MKHRDSEMHNFEFDMEELNRLVDAEVDRELSEKGIMRLQGLIDALANPRESDDVVFDFCGMAPTAPMSYRGYYDQLAFGFEVGKAPPAKEVQAWAVAAIGATYRGYKGGEYKMTGDTPLWVSEYGEASGTAIVGVKKLSWGRYVICTEYIDD